MDNNKKTRQFYYWYFGILSILIVGVTFWNGSQKIRTPNFKANQIKLYWFIPDGLRSDPLVFKIFDWAREGKLPHIKQMMEKGSYGYSIPVFPGHTPTNFATLLTGTTPDVHGIADGAMRVEGYPVKMTSKGGFTSQAKLVSPLWNTFEDNNFIVSLLSVPGSTPPELNNGITIKGRWGGWGIEFPAINFHSSLDEQLKVENGQNKRVFNFGSELTKFVLPKKDNQINFEIKSYSPMWKFDVSNWNAHLTAYLYDSTNDSVENYDGVILTKDGKTVFANVKEGSWTEWLPIKLEYEIKNDYNINTPKKSEIERKFSTLEVLTQTKIKLIRAGSEKKFRLRFLYNNLNEYLIKPSYLYDQINASVGPMVDFVDNYPPQLIYVPEDKPTFIEEANFSLEWHKKMSDYMMKNFENNVIIHSIYTPNQMLTSRWWMPYIDPESPKYNLVTESEREILWQEVLHLYQQIDEIIGNVLKNTDGNSYVILSSDHGAIPLYREVRLNNLFAKKGWLKFKYKASEGEYEIDWEKTKVVFLQMDNIYIHTKGLAKPYFRDEGLEYEALRSEVIKELENLKDENGIRPLAKILKREEASKLNLPGDRTGDLIIANSAHYNWVEDMASDLKIFHDSLKGGYKQSVIPSENKGMWTPFIIVGPKIKANVELKEPINHIDQYATILNLFDIPATKHQKGRVLKEILK
jgi:predicted AlkP superfamily phosphohydrolase/phosphomutase